MDALAKAKDALADKLSAASKGSSAEKISSATDAVKDALPAATESERAVDDTVGGTGLAAHVEDVIGECNAAAEDGAGGLMGQAAELVGGADKTAEEGTGGLMAAVPKMGDKVPQKKTGGLF